MQVNSVNYDETFQTFLVLFTDNAHDRSKSHSIAEENPEKKTFNLHDKYRDY